MTRGQFVRKYRHRITEIMRALKADGPINDRERELWVLNDEQIYRWAVSLGMDP